MTPRFRTLVVSLPLLMLAGGCVHARPPSVTCREGARGYVQGESRLFFEEGDQLLEAWSDHRKERAALAAACSPTDQGEGSDGSDGLIRLVTRLADGNGVTDGDCEAAFRRLRVHGPFFERYFAMSVLEVAPESCLTSHSRQLVDYLTSDGNEFIRKKALTLTGKLAARDRRDVWEAFLLQGSPALRRIVYAFAKVRDPVVADSMVTALRQSGHWEVDASLVGLTPATP